MSQSALITGASSGIGKVYAEHLARAGYDLVIVARRKPLLDSLALRLTQDYGIKVEVIEADLASSQGVTDVCKRIEEGARINLFINNAGYAARGTVASLDPDVLETMLQVNIIAMSRLSHSAMKRMTKEKSGKIINIASATAFILLPGNAGYGASKTYVLSFTRHMQLEALGTGVHIQALIPGVVATDFHQLAGADLANFPPERVMSADDLVSASLSALEMEELVCIPSLPEVKDWEAYQAAEKAVAANVSRNQPAARYSL
ncbi:SDR family NAD(P)-dependent oxidoreductase [Pseudomonas sp. NA-150]|uniref:SDR family NAD(P)-dependent oxidoreductase n=1 Tax=Pseudomonas sp. NA-150 TaxID=3367525 RepID=UPI0037C984A5